MNIKKILYAFCIISLLSSCSDKSTQENTNSTKDTEKQVEEQAENQSEYKINMLEDIETDYEVLDEYKGLYEWSLNNFLGNDRETNLKKANDLFNEVILDIQKKGNMPLDYATLARDTISDNATASYALESTLYYKSTTDYISKNMPAFVDGEQANELIIDYNNVDISELPMDPNEKVPIIKIDGFVRNITSSSPSNDLPYETYTAEVVSMHGDLLLLHYIGNIYDYIGPDDGISLWVLPIFHYNYNVEAQAGNYDVGVLYMLSGPGLQEVYPESY